MALAITLTAKQSTKYTELTFYMSNGLVISGQFHIPLTSSYSVRPSDALKEAGPLINLLNAEVEKEGHVVDSADFLQICRDSIVWIKFPAMGESWKKGITHKQPEHGK